MLILKFSNQVKTGIPTFRRKRASTWRIGRNRSARMAILFRHGRYEDSRMFFEEIKHPGEA
jgi:hypothetical protein